MVEPESNTEKPEEQPAKDGEYPKGRANERRQHGNRNYDQEESDHDQFGRESHTVTSPATQK